MLAKRKFFYGWVVAACCVMLAFSINAMGNNSMTFMSRRCPGLWHLPHYHEFRCSPHRSSPETLCGFFYGSFVRKFGVKS